MPDSNSAGVIGSLIGGVSFLGGVAVSLIGKGKRDQRIDSTIESHEKKLISLEEAMKNLAASLVVDGNPRFVTVLACKGEQGHCRDVWAEKLLAGNARFGVIEADIKEIKESQNNNFRDIIDEIRKNK